MTQASIPFTGRVAASFRDPSGYVFQHDGRIFRAITDECYATLQSLKDDGLWDSLIGNGMIVPTHFIPKNSCLHQELQRGHGRFHYFLEHERIAFLSYPYEWSVSMLADAAILTLDLQRELLLSKYSLKDATAFNVQFVGSRPVFIDLGSVDQNMRVDVWYALAQFNQMFLFPLLLSRYHGWDLKSYFLANPSGRELEKIIHTFSFLELCRPRLLLDVTLPWLLRPRTSTNHRIDKAFWEKPNTSPASQLLNLQRLRNKVQRLAANYSVRGNWTNYTTTCNYEAGSQSFKMEWIRKQLTAIRPQQVLDVGCNTGEYSFLAAEIGATVIAIDQDHDSVELLYRRARQQKAAVTPLVVDITQPSPGVGMRNKEWTGFLERTQVDCVFALALVHHLMVKGNLQPAAIRDLFFDVTDDYLIVEYVSPSDKMFESLLEYRIGQFNDLTLDSFRQTFLQRFDLIEECGIPDSSRTLFCLQKKQK